MAKINISEATYLSLCDRIAADFAAIEAAVSGDVLATVLRLHGRAVYVRNLIDGQLGIVRAMDGTNKPPPNP